MVGGIQGATRSTPSLVSYSYIYIYSTSTF
nr:MAG TPA: hypothetical protein [Caudoviricetes sp.]